MPVNVEPTLNVPLPDTLGRHPEMDHADDIRVKANTAMIMQELGSGIEMTGDDIDKATSLFNSLGKKRTKEQKQEEKSAISTPGTALAMAGYLSQYDQQIVQDKVQLRSVITNRLLEISQCGDVKHELKSLELLGKACDLFTERSEITITHKNSAELQEAIREKIRVLMQMNTIDVTPKSERLTNSLDSIDEQAAD